MRKDDNHFQIMKFAELCGGFCLDVSKVPRGFDLLVFFNGRSYAFEIKDGNKNKSQQKLTDGELECQLDVVSTGNKYHVVNCHWDVLTVLGLEPLLDPEERKRLKLMLMEYIIVLVKFKNLLNKKLRYGMTKAIKSHEGGLKLFFVRLCEKHEIKSTYLKPKKAK